jgi:aminocarboxymuconate-semialdehyde decarboxylase
MIVDIHAHLFPPEWVARLPIPPAVGDVHQLLDVKAAAGIDVTLVGSPSGAATMVPVPGAGRLRQPLDRLRAYHDWLADVVRARPDRIRAYAYCDPFADDAMLDAVAEALSGDEFVGVITNPSVDGAYLDSPRADGMLALAAERDVPILLHSGSMPACCGGIGDYGLFETVGRLCDVTIGMAVLVASGRLAQYPDLRVIATSGGAALGLLPEALDRTWPAGVGGPPSVVLSRIYVDTTIDNPYALRSSLALVGPERMLFGTDWPPVPVVHEEKLRSVAELPMTAAERADVLGGNAERIFKLS